MYEKDIVFERLKELVRSGLSRKDATTQLVIERGVKDGSTISSQCGRDQGFSGMPELDEHLRSLGLDPEKGGYL
ncbi:MAG: hypothetical protein OXH16_07575 [Gemmatimonadetes bacterium]|nr:hypothetical protein [Gemmatimonadota bacterium]